ncbi:hypothetical protein BH09VER1_BH09VER1_40660 [soil metagenome]
MTQRGLILLEQQRYPEAEKYFRDALASEPNDPVALYHLAICQSHQHREKEALETVDRALSLEPNDGDFHALKSLILIDLRRVKEALVESEEALRLDPDSDIALNSRAASLLSNKEWAMGEHAARKALEINPENHFASTQLAYALRMQNRLEESAEQTSYMLEQDPDNTSNHTTAGWLCLQRGDNKGAETHFLEALRLHPNNHGAREGLKEAFKARSFIYRRYLQYCFFMQRLTSGNQWLVFIGLIFAVNIGKNLLPYPWNIGLIVTYFLFVLWVHVARAVGNFQIQFDPVARHSLSAGEKWEASIVGGGVTLGLPFFIIGIIFGLQPLLISGATLMAAAFPLTYTFNNEVTAGRYIFGATGLFIYVVGAANLLHEFSDSGRDEGLAGLTTIAWFAVIAVTWLCNVPSLNRRRY